MGKILIIEKCQDCKYKKCKLRKLSKNIPKECPLQGIWVYQDIPVEINIKDIVLNVESENEDILGL
ncbi:MAG TPA: hypothetical protein P5513_06090 [Candidatus Diapherotrites archaeon]|jgi:hypothetical protein|nr:hypothetical protein [Candidatus Diapherotrites archaeon]